MKKKILIITAVSMCILVAIIFSFSGQKPHKNLDVTGCSNGCSNTLRGTDELIKKAREEIPIADAENIDIQYAGLVGKDDEVLIWFISGNEYQAHYYLPMVCSVVGENEYKFIQTFKPMERGKDIAVYQWKRGYCFLVNNPECTAIRITGSTGKVTEISIEKDVYPFIEYYEDLPTEYVFLDRDGNEID